MQLTAAPAFFRNAAAARPVAPAPPKTATALDANICVGVFIVADVCVRN